MKCGVLKTLLKEKPVEELLQKTWRHEELLPTSMNFFHGWGRGPLMQIPKVPYFIPMDNFTCTILTINGGCSLVVPVQSVFEAAVSITRAI